MATSFSRIYALCQLKYTVLEWYWPYHDCRILDPFTIKCIEWELEAAKTLIITAPSNLSPQFAQNMSPYSDSVFTKKPSFLQEFSRTLPTLFFIFTKRCFISIELNQKRHKRSCCSYCCCNTYTYASLLLVTSKTNRTYHRSSMQAEKSQPDGKRIMPETRFTSFPALPVDPRVGISPSESETYDWLFFLPITE